MLKIRYALFIMLLGMPLHSVAWTSAQVSIGINLPIYPELVVVPGYPVYYAPQEEMNFFFYDGMYWVYENDNWYSGFWYNGPWWFVEPEFVPVFILRVPVRYYRRPPAYFHGWPADGSPHWGDHWGRDWEHRRGGWNRWNRRAAPAPAPLPVYQKQYSADQYPRQVEQQRQLQEHNYRYRPNDPVVRQHYRKQAGQKAAVQQKQQGRPEVQAHRPPPRAAQREQQVQKSHVREEKQQARDTARKQKRKQDQERSGHRNE